jgi:hypothetical protein
VYQIITGKAHVGTAVEMLMQRTIKEEHL